MRALLLLLLLPASAAAQSITPQFTQGSMTATTTTTQTIDETIAHEIYGGAMSKYTGENVTPSTTITDSSATWSVTTAADPWTLEFTDRTAGVIETIDIDRTIDIDSTTTSLSIFSQ
jgi:hypothetical protein|tara:strand:+ start:373 stop:723 length:351 start_codon:yes stop_codon:yes gene_type:complete